MGGNDPTRGATEQSYSQLMDRVAEKQISSVTTRPDALISIGSENQKFVTYLPQLKSLEGDPFEKNSIYLAPIKICGSP